MLFCKTSCYIASIFMIASIYTSLKTDKEGIIKPLVDKLTPQQKVNYDKIRDDRRNIYMKGLLYGLLLGLFMIYINNKSLFSLVDISNNGCYILSIMLVVSYLYYILSPKKSIITDLHNSKQRDAWYKVYKHMQFNYHTGAVLAIIGGAIYGWQYCK
jgi:SNF family Na+-dependent transporter